MKTKNKRFPEVEELDGICLGPVVMVNDDENEYDYKYSEVLKIFPDGNLTTDSHNPYYVKLNNGKVDYFSRGSFKRTNIIEIEKCALIAEFMEREFRAYSGNHSYAETFKSYSACERWIKRENLIGFFPQLDMNIGCGLYHKYWDWLMPVVDKINRLKNPRGISDTTLSTMKSDLRAYVGRVNIESAFNAAYKIIEWHNT